MTIISGNDNFNHFSIEIKLNFKISLFNQLSRDKDEKMKKSVLWGIGIGTIVVVTAIVVGVILGIQLTKKDFSKEFQFGAATSSYQIEGAWNRDGKSENIWDRATNRFPNIITGRTNGNDAANSYEFYKKDVKAVKDSGVRKIREIQKFFLNFLLI